MTSASNSRSRILVVDDDPISLKLLSEMVPADAFEVDTARDGRGALGLLQERPYSLLITDLQMPVMSGIELIKELRARGLLLPILIVSGDCEALMQAAMADLGRTERILKPCDADAIQTAIARLLSQQ